MILDHIEPIEIPDDRVKDFSNEIRSLRYLSVGLGYLYNQVAKVEVELQNREDPSVRSFVVGNHPLFDGIPMDLVASSFHWYAVSACNYIRMVGWIWGKIDASAPRPLGYLKSIAKDMKAWRDKVAAHFAKCGGSQHDSEAERAASVLYPIGFSDGRLIAQPLQITVTCSGKTTTSKVLAPWALTEVHRMLQERYRPDTTPTGVAGSTPSRSAFIRTTAAKNALDLYVKHYVKGDTKAWSIAHQMELYAAGARAFQDPSDSSHFARIYNSLRSYWKVFRGTKGCWNLERTFAELMHLPEALRGRRLTQLQDDEWKLVWECIYHLREIKPNKYEPSLTAVSKFLHFWNPRLFVIFDSEAMDSWAFGHKWVRSLMPSEDKVSGLHGDSLPKERNLVKYLKVLRFASDFIKANGHLMRFFCTTVQANAGDAPIPDDIESYEATAVEWCLLGLVESLPAGVQINKR